ncbi:unnamed protein product [Caenorhabditis auriculariae]|uniref:Galectin n=1 Tax=Caenorhabditis auriculariae TaxID=2777116 RepID=A0A8S1H018_9PELO|nr:unnamed protein product [Caenorhabditis auriculariae]
MMILHSIAIQFYSEKPIYLTDYMPLRMTVNLNTQMTGLWSYKIYQGWSIGKIKKSSIKSGRDFEIKIIAGQKDYLIFINGKFFDTFTYRVGYHISTCYITIEGPIQFTGATKKCENSSFPDNTDDQQLIAIEDGTIYSYVGPFGGISSFKPKESHDHK